LADNEAFFRPVELFTPHANNLPRANQIKFFNIRKRQKTEFHKSNTFPEQGLPFNSKRFGRRLAMLPPWSSELYSNSLVKKGKRSNQLVFFTVS
jgi:hypothetical protein